MSKKGKIDGLERNLISAYRQTPVPEPEGSMQQNVLDSTHEVSGREVAVAMPQHIGAHVLSFAGTAATLALILWIYFFVVLDTTSVNSPLAFLTNPFAFLGI